MESYLIYIGKAALAAGTFYLAYLVLFQNRKQFVFNRIYLPVSLALSFIIPLITFTTVKYIEAPTTGANSFTYLSQAAVSTETYSESPSLWPHYLFGLYLLGIAGFLFHLLAGHFNAIRMVWESHIKNLLGSRVHITKKDVHPFSFFNKIVLSEKTLNSPNLEMIVAHENIHVKEKHTLDILATELLFLLQWFNPFAWLMKDAVKNNLEYKTDDKIVKTNDPQTYQLAMVALADKKGVAPFLTALNGSQLKNRIVMMKKKTENKFTPLKQLVILPLLAVLVMGLSNKEVKTEIVQTRNLGYSTQNNESNDNILKKNRQTDLSKIYNGTDANFNNIIGEKNIKSSTDTIQETLGAAEKQKKDNVEDSNIPVEEIVTFRLLKDSSVIFQYGEKDENGETIIKTITRQNATTVNQQKDTLASINENSVSFKVEEMPTFPGGELALKKYIQENLKYPPIALDKGIWGKVYVSIIISNEGEVTNPMIVKGVDPYLNKEALRVINTLPDWKPGKQNGMPVNVHYTVPVDFEIKGKLRKEKNLAEELSVPNPLYVIDGVEYEEMPENIDSDDIKSIDVLKGESGTKHYGEKGKNGVILIHTKNNVEKSLQGRIDNSKLKSSENLERMSLKSPEGGTPPLFILDGKEVATIDDISPEAIERIEVLKDKSATDLYGKRGENGVIVITTKKYAEQNKITTEMGLRKFIAEKIRYPVEASEINKKGIVQLFIELDNNGKVNKISEKASGDELFLEEVVVVGYQNKDDVIIRSSIDTKNEVLKDEVKRVINQLPEIEIPEFNRKTVGITVKFVLQ